MAESISDNIDLLSLILLRLPSKSVLRFKCVCKSWRGLITSSHFRLLWRRRQEGRPGILLRYPIRGGHNLDVPLSGSAAADMPRLEEIPRLVHNSVVLQSYNGFILHRRCGDKFLLPSYWVSNPATWEEIPVPLLRMNACCMIHEASRCTCIFTGRPVLSFGGRLVVVAEDVRTDFCQVCVAEKQGFWRNSGNVFKSSSMLSDGVSWRNFVAWFNVERTVFYDVTGGQRLRACDSPHYSMESPMRDLLRESGGHLLLVHDQGSRLIINEMKEDLSGWFVKHSIGMNHIQESLSRSIDWDGGKFNVNCVFEGADGSKLVLGCHRYVVLYRIQDNKSWKLCELEVEVIDRGNIPWFCDTKLVDLHVNNISRFQDLDQ